MISPRKKPKVSSPGIGNRIPDTSVASRCKGQQPPLPENHIIQTVRENPVVLRRRMVHPVAEHRRLVHPANLQLLHLDGDEEVLQFLQKQIHVPRKRRRCWEACPAARLTARRS